MKLIIAGSRDISPLPQEIAYWIEEKFKIENIECIFSGAAMGADKAGETYANMKGKKIKNFPASWKMYGRSAGPIRNKEMAKQADCAIVFMNNKSSGSQNMINEMCIKNKPVYVIEFKDKKFKKAYLLENKKKSENVDITQFSV